MFFALRPTFVLMLACAESVFFNRPHSGIVMNGFSGSLPACLGDLPALQFL
jgi:hypothetical protein